MPTQPDLEVRGGEEAFHKDGDVALDAAAGVTVEMGDEQIRPDTDS